MLDREENDRDRRDPTRVEQIYEAVIKLTISFQNVGDRIEKLEKAVSERLVSRKEFEANESARRNEDGLRLEAIKKDIEDLNKNFDKLEDNQTWVVRGILTAVGAIAVSAMIFFIKTGK